MFSTGFSPAARSGYSTAPERCGWSTRSRPPGLASTQCELDGVERDDTGRPTGRLWRMDRWLAERVPGLRRGPGRGEQDGGVAGDHGLYRRDPRCDRRRPRVSWPRHRSRSACTAWRRPGYARQARRSRLGPVKFMLDDTTLPPLAPARRRDPRRARGRPAVAVHCVTRVQFVLTLAALDLAGRRPGDRIEHGAVIGADSLPDLHGLTVVTQPHFVAERGEQYAADVPPGDRPDLWRLRSLDRRGGGRRRGHRRPVR